MQNELNHGQWQQIPNAGYDLYDAEQHKDYAERYVQTYIGRMLVTFATRTHFVESVRYALFGIRKSIGRDVRSLISRQQRLCGALFFSLNLSLTLVPKRIRFDLLSLWLSGHFNRLHSIYYSSFQRSNWILYVSFGMPHHQKNDRVDFVTETDGCLIFSSSTSQIFPVLPLLSPTVVSFRCE